MARRAIACAAAVATAASVTLSPLPVRADLLISEILRPTEAVVIEPAPKYLELVKSYGPSGPPASGNGSSNGVEFGESEMTSLGCLVGGSVGMGAAVAIGAANISNLIAGGLVPAASPAALYASLFGVVFATFCAVGQAMTPLVIYGYKRFTEPSEDVGPTLVAPPRAPVVSGFYKISYEPN